MARDHPGPDPSVSVVIATYDRSNVLRLAVESVLAQSFRDWELWVVGDACTDDSEEVVAGFADPRVKFVNLDTNHGSQSAPNMEGVRRSVGRHIAFLNHDDLWLPDHLEVAMEGIERTGADMVFTLVEQVDSAESKRLACMTTSGRFEPHFFVPASCWLLRREAHDRVGPWRPPHECHELPSENWMHRAWKAGLDVRLVPCLTVVTFPFGFRNQRYRDRPDHEQSLYWARIRAEPDFRVRELTSLALRHAAEQAAPQPVATHLARAVKHAVRRWSVRLGIHPRAVYNFIRYRRRGGFVDEVQRRRGLPLKTKRMQP